MVARKEYLMSIDKMDTLTLAQLRAIAAGAVKGLLPNGDEKTKIRASYAGRQDAASI